MKTEKLFDLIIKYLLPAMFAVAVLAFMVTDLFDLQLHPLIVSLGIIPLIVTAYMRMRSEYSFFPRNGLSKHDVLNIQFVKRWHQTRQQGMRRFVVMDGAVIFGAILCIVLNLVIFSLWNTAFRAHLADGPAKIFKLIGFSYIAGAMIGAACHRLLWIYNERRFDRLTNPLL